MRKVTAFLKYTDVRLQWVGRKRKKNHLQMLNACKQEYMWPFNSAKSHLFDQRQGDADHLWSSLHTFSWAFMNAFKEKTSHIYVYFSNLQPEQTVWYLWILKYRLFLFLWRWKLASRIYAQALLSYSHIYSYNTFVVYLHGLHIKYYHNQMNQLKKCIIHFFSYYDVLMWKTPLWLVPPVKCC